MVNSSPCQRQQLFIQICFLFRSWQLGNKLIQRLVDVKHEVIAIDLRLVIFTSRLSFRAWLRQIIFGGSVSSCFSVTSNLHQSDIVRILIFSIKSRFIIVLAVTAHCKAFTKDLAQINIAYTLQAGTATQGEELQELSQFFIEAWVSTVFPDLLNLFKRQVTIAVLIFQI